MFVNEKVANTIRIPQPEGRANYYRLDQNENSVGIPQWLFEQVKNAINPEFLAIYPEETLLTELYAEKFNLPKSTVTLTDGSVVGMGYIIKVFGEPGKTLLSVTPTFGMYKVYAEMQGMTVCQLSYASDFTFDTDTILQAINDDTGIVVLVNPNMPVGNAYEQKDILKIVQKAKQHNAYVIIDEAYYYFHDEDSIEIQKQYDNVFILRTFSKMLSIPALRLGVIISSSKNIQYLNNYKPHYTVNSVALLFGEAIIKNHDTLIKELRQNFFKNKEWLLEQLRRLGYEFIDSKGCFLCIKPKQKSARDLTAKLKEHGILVLCGSGDLSKFLRVSIVDISILEVFITKLVELDI